MLVISWRLCFWAITMETWLGGCFSLLAVAGRRVRSKWSRPSSIEVECGNQVFGWMDWNASFPNQPSHHFNPQVLGKALEAGKKQSRKLYGKKQLCCTWKGISCKIVVFLKPTLLNLLLLLERGRWPWWSLEAWRLNACDVSETLSHGNTAKWSCLNRDLHASDACHEAT